MIPNPIMAERTGHERTFRRRLMPLRAKVLLAALIGGVLGGTASWGVFPSAAHAVNQCDNNGAYHVFATDSKTNFSHDGVRVANMEIYDYDATCVHVSSVEVNTTTGDEAEIGWHDQDTSWSNCYVVGDDHPHILTTYISAGVYVCRQFGLLTPGQSDAFSAWGDSSNVWSWAHDGSNLVQVTLDFRAGHVVSNAERHSSAESAQASFNGLQYGTSPNWISWPQSVCGTDNDPNYNNQLHSATYVTVSQSAAQC